MLEGPGASARLVDPGISSDTLVRLLDMSVDAIITVDEENRIVQFNRGAETIFGYEASEVFGKTLDLLLPTEARDPHREHMARFATSVDLARHMSHRTQIAGQRRSGERFPAEASIVKLESDGEIYLGVVLRDITEREREETARQFLVDAGNALATSLDQESTVSRLAALAVPALGDACIVDVHENGELTALAAATRDGAQVLPRTARLAVLTADFTHPLAGVVEHRAPLLLGPRDASLPIAIARDVARAPIGPMENFHFAMYLALTAQGVLHGTMTCLSRRPLTGRDLALAGELAQRGALAIAHARLYADSRKATRSRDEVLAVVSHDLRNPLSTITMCASALSDPVAPSVADVRSMADIIRQSADWAQRIIRDLLDATSIEAGRLSIDRRAVSVDAIVHASRELFVTQAEAAGIRLIASCASDLPKVDADTERVLQVTFNLLGNAMKFTSRGGIVGIEAALNEDGSAVRFRVSDTGTGIPLEHLPHLFDRFWQLHHAHRGGAGLGLAIAKGIVSAHGGTIGVTSTVGVGSTFTFTIPLAT